MKKILLGLLFVGGSVNCQKLLSYVDYLKFEELVEKLATHQGKKCVALDDKKFETGKLLVREVMRCEKANDCGTSVELLHLFGEFLKVSTELKQAEEDLKKEPETKECNEFVREIVSKL